jgi:hypothetical protein
MESDDLIIVPWSALKSLDTGRLGYLGTLASGNLKGEERQYSIWSDIACLPREELEMGSYCLVGIKSSAAQSHMRREEGIGSLVMPVHVADIEVAYFTSASRRQEFLADLKVSGMLQRSLPFPQLVFPGEMISAVPVPNEEDLVAQAKMFNEELAFQERISAAIACADAHNWWRARDLPKLRGSQSIDKYSRLLAWARSAQGVVDGDGSWSRTSVEQVFPLLVKAGLVDQVNTYQTYVGGDGWPISENALVATALLLLARTEGGTPESLVNQVMALNGLAMPSEYALSDVMIYLAVGLGRHSLPSPWRPTEENLSALVRSEIEYASLAYAETVIKTALPLSTQVEQTDGGTQPKAPSPKKRGGPKVKGVAREVADVSVPPATVDGEQLDLYGKTELDSFLKPESGSEEVPPIDSAQPLELHRETSEESN